MPDADHRVLIVDDEAQIRQFLRAGLIDELHLAVRPVLLGEGENLFAGLDWHALGYTCVESIAGEPASIGFNRSERGGALELAWRSAR